MIITHELRYKTMQGISVELDLPDTLNILEGDSGAGKTFCANFLASLNSNVDVIRNGWQIVLVTHRATDILSTLMQLKESLIIVDNADMLLKDRRDIVKYINGDRGNQYLIFARGNLGFNTPRYARGWLLSDKVGRRIYTQYREG